uniref:Uncharacterized protein n=1 Tax=Ascaris lumbricoides TaxID=6252 RepID=A0A0M3IU05_ASCLU
MCRCHMHNHSKRQPSHNRQTSSKWSRSVSMCNK